jgi:hypothetical protein
MAILVVCAACGDGYEQPPTIEPVSGTRIKLELYRYDDGTSQVDASAFYDTVQHTRCQPRRWVDDIVRCVPIAGEAVYSDADCTEVVGLGPMKQKPAPTHFLGMDWADTGPVPARLYHAGATTTPIGEYYLRQNGACIGPGALPSDVTFYAVDKELPATAMPVVDDAELGVGRLALQVERTIDGMQVAVGLRDRMLDLPCTPTSRDGAVACEPVGVATATGFLDSKCATPVVVVPSDAALPAAVRVAEPTGCASYFTVGAEVSAALYRREAGACVHASVSPGQRAFALADPIELAQLDRTVDDSSRRLAAVTFEDLSDPGLRFTGDRLVDQAIRNECRPDLLGDRMRCVPSTVQPAMTLYTPGCTIAVPVVELPERTCSPVTFASTPSEDGTQVELRAIGDPITSPLFEVTAAGCTPYVPEPGRVVRSLGPPLPAETFVGAMKYGER